MAVDIGCASDSYMVSQRGGSGHAGSARHHTMFTQAAVVRDLNQIINFTALSDHSVIKRAAVHSGIGPDFDIIFNSNATDLRNLHPLTFKGSKAKAVTTDHATRLQYTTGSNRAVMINGDIRMQARIVTNDRAHSHHTVGANPSARPNHSMIFDNGAGVHSSRRINLRCHGNRGVRVNAACKLILKLFDNLQSKSKPGIRIGRDNHRSRCFFAVNSFFIFLAKHNDAGLAVFDFMNKFRIGQKCHFIRFGMA